MEAQFGEHVELGFVRCGDRDDGHEQLRPLLTLDRRALEVRPSRRQMLHPHETLDAREQSGGALVVALVVAVVVADVRESAYLRENGDVWESESGRENVDDRGSESVRENVDGQESADVRQREDHRKTADPPEPGNCLRGSP